MLALDTVWNIIIEFLEINQYSNIVVDNINLSLFVFKSSGFINHYFVEIS